MRIKAFRWDRKNLRHIARHHVNAEEVEEVFLARQELRALGARRYILFGRSLGGRYMLVVFDHQADGIVSVVTARDLTAREKQRLRKRQKGA